MLQTLTLPGLILACSASPMPQVHSTLHRISVAHSRGNATYVFNASTMKAYSNLAGEKQATSIIKQLAAAKHDVHVGLTGLSPQAIARWKVTPSMALDACTNIRVASLELRHLGVGRLREQRLHRVLARYWQPLAPTSMEAIDWGAAVLHQPILNVAKEVNNPAQQASAVYTVKRTLVVNINSTSGAESRGLVTRLTASRTAPVKWSQAPSKEVKAKTSRKASDSDESTSLAPPKLTHDDLAPYPKGTGQPPVTDRILE